MSDIEDVRERLARLEEREIARDHREAAMARKVDEMHTLLVQAKGARWAVIGFLTLAGSVIGWIASHLQMLRG